MKGNKSVSSEHLLLKGLRAYTMTVTLVLAMVAAGIITYLMMVFTQLCLSPEDETHGSKTHSYWGDGLFIPLYLYTELNFSLSKFLSSYKLK